MTSPDWPVEIKHSQECECTRVVYSITFKLTDFVWELSTVLHVELDLTEDITNTQTSYKFLPMWRRKEDESGLKHGFIPVTAIFGNLECDWLKCRWMVGVWSRDYKTGKKHNLRRRNTGLYQFITRFLFTLDCTFAKWLSDILKELFMVKKLRKPFNYNGV